jgi:hypothetical protein
VPTDDQLERTLRDLGANLQVATGRDLTAHVMDRIGGGPDTPPRASRDRPVGLLVAAAVVLIAFLLAFAAPVRSAVASMLEFVGIDIRHSDVGASPPAPSPPTNSELGQPVSVAEVSQAAGFVVPVPRTGELGSPDEAYLLDGGDHQIVTLVWRRADDITVSPASDAAVIFSVFQGGPPQVEYLEKILFQGSRAHKVAVNGNLGVYVDGPQTVLYLSTNRDVEEAQSRLSGNSLIWQQDGLTFRLESALGQQASVAIAESVR